MISFCFICLEPYFLRSRQNEVFKSQVIRLYQPDKELRNRIGDDVIPLSNYIHALEKIAISILEKITPQEAGGLLIAVGIKPGKRSRVWCEAISGSFASEHLEKLENDLTKITPIEVKHGSIAFALEAILWNKKVDKFPIIPKVWEEAIKKLKPEMTKMTIPDDLFKIIWPD